MNRLIIFLVLICLSTAAAAEMAKIKIKLKSGRVVIGDMIEKTETFIKINSGGNTTTYYLDDIENQETLNDLETAGDKPATSGKDPRVTKADVEAYFKKMGELNTKFGRLTGDITKKLKENLDDEALKKIEADFSEQWSSLFSSDFEQLAVPKTCKIYHKLNRQIIALLKKQTDISLEMNKLRDMLAKRQYAMKLQPVMEEFTSLSKRLDDEFRSLCDQYGIDPKKF